MLFLESVLLETDSLAYVPTNRAKGNPGLFGSRFVTFCLSTITVLNQLVFRIFSIGFFKNSKFQKWGAEIKITCSTNLKVFNVVLSQNKIANFC